MLSKALILSAFFVRSADADSVAKETGSPKRLATPAATASPVARLGIIDIQRMDMIQTARPDRFEGLSVPLPTLPAEVSPAPDQAPPQETSAIDSLVHLNPAAPPQTGSDPMTMELVLRQGYAGENLQAAEGSAVPALPNPASSGRLLGLFRRDYDLSFSPELEEAAAALRKDPTPQNGRRAVDIAVALLAAKGVKAKPECDDAGCRAVIEPLAKAEQEALKAAIKHKQQVPPRHWLTHMATAIARREHKLVFDVLDLIQLGGHYLNLADRKQVALPWGNLNSSYASSGARHELSHYHHATGPRQPLRVRLLEPAGQPKGLLSAMLGPYTDEGGHDIDEFRAYAYQVRADLAAAAGMVATARKLEAAASPAAVELAVEAALQKLQEADIYRDQVLGMTHFPRNRLNAFVSEPDRIDAAPLPEAKALGAQPWLFTMKPHGKEYIDMDVGTQVFFLARRLQGAEEPVFTRETMGPALQAISSEMGAARAQMDALEKKIEAQRQEALAVLARTADRLPTDDLKGTLLGAMAQLREELADKSLDYKERRPAEQMLVTLAMGYLKRIGVPARLRAYHHETQIEILPAEKGQKVTHWLTRMATRLKEKLDKPLVFSPDDSVKDKARSFLYGRIQLPWDNITASQPSVETLAGFVIAEHNKTVELDYKSQWNGPRPVPLAAYGRRKPPMQILFGKSAYDDDAAWHYTTEIYALNYEANAYLKSAKSLIGKHLRGPEPQAAAAAREAAQNSLEAGRRALDLLEKDIPVFEQAVSKLGEAAELESRKPKKVRKPDPKSAQEAAAQHVLEDLNGVMESFDEIEGKPSQKPKPLIGGGGRNSAERYLYLADDLRLDFKREQIEARNKEIKGRWVDLVDYAYMDETDSDWSMKPGAVKDVVQYVLDGLRERQDVIRSLTQQAQEILQALPPKSAKAP